MSDDYYFELHPSPLEMHVYQGELLKEETHAYFNAARDDTEMKLSMQETEERVSDKNGLIVKLESVVEILKHRGDQIIKPEGKEDK